MSSMTLENNSPRITQLLSNIREGHRWLWWSILVLMLTMIVAIALHPFDTRLINGVNVWDKPGKFALSLAVQLSTVSWAIMQLPRDKRNMRGINVAVFIMVACTWAEMAYLIFRASRGEASHFNTATPVAALAYSIMGVGAVSISMSAAYVGWRLWKERRTGVWTEAAAIGLMVGMIIGTIAGAYMSAQTSHWVGGALTDANGTGFFRWSTTGGDLRIAHFFGLHGAQIIPFAALSGDRRIVYATAIFLTLLTAAVFAMGILGIPLLRV